MMSTTKHFLVSMHLLLSVLLGMIPSILGDETPESPNNNCGGTSRTQSVLGFPSNRGCGPKNGRLRYQVKLQTDEWGCETSVSSYSFKQEDYTALDELIFEQSGLASNTYHYFPSDDEYFCLEENRCYYFQVTDSYPHGTSENKKNYPIFEVSLGQESLFKGRPAVGEKVANEIFCTGNVCKDHKKGPRIGGDRKSCKKLVRGKKLNLLKKKCNKLNDRGHPVHKHCPETCGRKAGVGACHWWKGMKEELKEKAVFDLDLDASAFHKKNRGN